MNHSTYEFGDSFQCKRVFLSFPHCVRVYLTKLFIIFIVKILYGIWVRGWYQKYHPQPKARGLSTYLLKPIGIKKWYCNHSFFVKKNHQII